MAEYTVTYSEERTREGKNECTATVKKKGGTKVLATFCVTGYPEGTTGEAARKEVVKARFKRVLDKQALEAIEHPAMKKTDTIDDTDLDPSPVPMEIE